MKKHLKSRKGMTLVELVVTIAILGIVSGLGLGIVVSAMNNYSTAATVQKAQNVALQIESYIQGNAASASTVHFIDTSAGGEVPRSTESGNYYIEQDNGVVRTYYYDGTNRSIVMSYEGVEQITFEIELQKSNKMDSLNGCSLFLLYQIKMESGYVLDGQIVLNQIKYDVNQTYYEETISEVIVTDTEFVDTTGPIELFTGDPTVKTAVVFNRNEDN